MVSFTGSGKRIAEGDRVVTPSGQTGRVSHVGSEQVYIDGDAGFQITVARVSASRIARET